MSRVRAANAGNVLLNVEDVSLAFGGVKALQQVSFNVYEHEIRAIIGPNGAGKSSMLNVINGVYTPQHGRITFLGKVREHMDPHQAAADRDDPGPQPVAGRVRGEERTRVPRLLLRHGGRERPAVGPHGAAQGGR